MLPNVFKTFHNGYGLELQHNFVGISGLWSDGDITLYNNSLDGKQTYHCNALRHTTTQDPNMIVAISKNGVITAIDRRIDKETPLKNINTKLTQTAICTFGDIITVGKTNEIIGFDSRNMSKELFVLDEVHSDDVIQLGLWRGLLVSASQDNLCCIIDYSKGNDGIVETINVGKPLSTLSLLNNQYLTLVSDDNAFVIYDGEVSKSVVCIDDLRPLILNTEIYGSTVLKSILVNNQLSVCTALPVGDVIISDWLAGSLFVQKTVLNGHSGLVRDVLWLDQIVYTIGEDGVILARNSFTSQPPLINTSTPSFLNHQLD
ncbi:WD domain containing protein [Entamoeba marina]